MAGGSRGVVVKILTYNGNIQPVDVCVDEFCFLLFPVFTLSVKSYC
jgi:hypothetical protein